MKHLTELNNRTITLLNYNAFSLRFVQWRSVLIKSRSKLVRVVNNCDLAP